MYNKSKISEFDGNTHRLFWKDSDTEKKPDYMLKIVTFVDKLGGAIAMLLLRKTAEMNAGYTSAAKMFIEDSYVLDVLCNVNSIETLVERIQQAK